MAVQPPTSRQAAVTSALVVSPMGLALVEFIDPLVPALRIARPVGLGALPAALHRVNVILPLHPENGIPEAKIVPVGAAALARVHARAAGHRQADESQ